MNLAVRNPDRMSIKLRVERMMAGGEARQDGVDDVRSTTSPHSLTTTLKLRVQRCMQRLAGGAENGALTRSQSIQVVGDLLHVDAPTGRRMIQIAPHLMVAAQAENLLTPTNREAPRRGMRKDFSTRVMLESPVAPLSAPDVEPCVEDDEIVSPVAQGASPVTAVVKKGRLLRAATDGVRLRKTTRQGSSKMEVDEGDATGTSPGKRRKPPMPDFHTAVKMAVRLHGGQPAGINGKMKAWASEGVATVLSRDLGRSCKVQKR
ncbi:hypothetical protein T484DRAFT_1980511 [Baffinella frigidus]|nr:hypothetical protein T484DRAFT_1980511 [Cryptophyta sp. CCMP2293]|mmetsp:Transcript_51637/g.122320  ORF Transcript_51637/g.122320 Transcript_51637/m.122320 type:complete len:262 (+) Transcript_51637:145-930(+)